MEAVRTEALIMESCKHPNIIELYEFHEDKQSFYLVMELLHGELFNQILDKVYFSEPLSRHIIKQIASGIKYLHEERGIVHRDIKPENILYYAQPPIKDPKAYNENYKVFRGSQGEGYIVDGVGGAGIGLVKIADFGLSKILWNSTTQTPCGTVGYTAPEIVLDRHYTKSVDQWALGCLLYTMLCGFPPFFDDDLNLLTEKVAVGYYTFLSPWWDDISMGAKRLIDGLLTVDEQKRLTIDEFLQNEWVVSRQDLVVDSILCLDKCHIQTPLKSAVKLKEAINVSYEVTRLTENSDVGHGFKQCKLGDFKLDLKNSSLLQKRKMAALN